MNEQDLQNKSAATEMAQQLERGNLFTHTVLSRHSAHINEIESFLYAVVDVLISKGIAVPEVLQENVVRIKQELREKREDAYLGISLRPESIEEAEFVPVNCAERMHVCQAVCCKLDFALSSTEIESGQIKWDLGRPYFIRQEPRTCYCSHINPETRQCNIYHQRPSVCKQYSCANDGRIWKDFEKMELNQEWIDAHIGERKTRFTGASMYTGVQAPA
jgi:Fe-S-cluster containining protein